jgi:hypothetical protein
MSDHCVIAFSEIIFVAVFIIIFICLTLPRRAAQFFFFSFTRRFRQMQTLGLADTTT